MTKTTEGAEKKPTGSGKRTKTGEPVTQVDLNPTIEESTAVFSWARMNPPTRGHERLVETMESIPGKPLVYLSHSSGSKRNPLSYEDKLEYARIAFGESIVDSPARTVVAALKDIAESYDHLVMVVGEDRVEEFTTMLEGYNESDFGFETWEVASAGVRNVDSPNVEGVSASSLREACVTDDFDRVLACLPTSLLEYAEEIQTKVAAVYDVDTSIDMNQKRARGEQIARVRALARGE